MGYLFVNALLIASLKTSFLSANEPPDEKTKRRGSNTGTMTLPVVEFSRQEYKIGKVFA